MGRPVIVEYLYLDKKTCDRCIGTDVALDEVMRALTPALKMAGCDVAYRKIEISTAEDAVAHRFLSSPTIRINGRDLCGRVAENGCACCGAISGGAVDCRVFEYEGQTYEVPPGEMLARGILAAALSETEVASPGEYALPANLAAFFAGKARRAAVAAKRLRGERVSMALFGKRIDRKEIARGGQAGAGGAGASVKVLGSGCARCNQLAAATKAALAQLDMDEEIDHVTDFAQIAAYGVMAMPALVVDGAVVSSGRVLKQDEVVAILRKARG